MNNNNWFIESISLTEASPPTKEDMERLLPSSWPKGWKEIERYSGSGSLWIKIGHCSPDSHYAANEGINVHLLPETPPGINLSKYDFTADLRVTYVRDSETDILNLNESKSHAEKELLKARKLLQKSGGELSKEERYSLEKLMNQASQFVSQVKEMKYLGKKARGISTPDGKMGVLSVSIGRFVLDRSLIGSELYLKPGSTKIHSVKCYGTRRAHEPQRLKGECKCWACSSHKPCSTLKAEGFIHREEVEQILRDIFSRCKGEKEEGRGPSVIIERSGTEIRNPSEKFKIESGDKIKTDKRIEVTITFGDDIKLKIGESTTVDMGDFIVSTVPGDSRVKIKEPLIPDLSVGTLTAIINKLKPRTKFEIHTPTGSTGVRGTIFSLWTDGQTTSLTVVEGEVEFSDLKGNKVIVKSNQTCICSKDQGLQQTVTLPINLKEQFKGA